MANIVQIAGDAWNESMITATVALIASQCSNVSKEIYVPQDRRRPVRAMLYDAGPDGRRAAKRLRAFTTADAR